MKGLSRVEYRVGTQNPRVPTPHNLSSTYSNIATSVTRPVQRLQGPSIDNRLLERIVRTWKRIDECRVALWIAFGE